MAGSLLSLTELSPGAPDRWYLLESTATLEVDRPESQSAPPDLENQIRQFVKRVLASKEESPHLVLFSHGYSNDRPAVLARIEKARKVTSGPDLAPSGTFYIGYRWPSERIFTPVRSLFTGLTSLLWLALILGLLLLGWGLGWPPKPDWLAILGWGLVAMVVGVLGLRLIAYYRDSYRASNYGVLDLVEFVRRLDVELYEQQSLKRVSISFIGHSMGGFVVTNVLRILSDVFDPQTIGSAKSQPKPELATTKPQPMEPSRLAPREATPVDQSNSNLGHCLRLLRIVLVSPDIPALALVTGRANFLGPSIRRCCEAYLVSNGGDIVLSLISVLANYFSFPAARIANAARLGNVQVVADEPGIVAPTGDLLSSLRMGRANLRKLQESCDLGHEESTIAQSFTYIDCTGFRANGKRRLSNSSGKGHVSFFSQLRGLGQYLGATVFKRGIDCHSGYFDFDETLELIFGCASIGILGLAKVKGKDVEDRVKELGLRICPSATLGSKL